MENAFVSCSLHVHRPKPICGFCVFAPGGPGPHWGYTAGPYWVIRWYHTLNGQTLSSLLSFSLHLLSLSTPGRIVGDNQRLGPSWGPAIAPKFCEADSSRPS